MTRKAERQSRRTGRGSPRMVARLRLGPVAGQADLTWCETREAAENIIKPATGRSAKHSMNRKYLGVCIGLGICAGAALGAAMGHVGRGVALGLILGVVLGAAVGRRSGKE